MTISVVTPTLNAERFLAETLRSVADQDVAGLEHIVVDGGSTDGTAAVVAGFPEVRFVSRPGMGQTDAMNLGISLARGECVSLLNADDVLLPGALRQLLAGFERFPAADIVYGEADHVDADGTVVNRYATLPFSRAALGEHCIICQAATLVRRSTVVNAGGLDSRLNFAMDYDLWLRLAPAATFVKIDALVAHARLHATAKTVRDPDAIYREVFDVQLRRLSYVSNSWLYGYADYLVQGGSQQFEPRPPTPRKIWLALWLGWKLNRTQRLRTTLDWLDRRPIGRVLRAVRRPAWAWERLRRRLVAPGPASPP